MNTRSILPVLLGALWLALATAAWAGPIGEGGPVGRVRALYERIQGGAAAATDDLDLLRDMAAPGLRALMDRERACRAAGEGPCRLGFSVMADDRQRLVTHVEVSLTRGSPARAEVLASFRNAGRPHAVVYRFAWDGGRWRLTDVRSGGNPAWSLVELLERPPAASGPAASGPAASPATPSTTTPAQP
ncbi:MAG: hypothetical protein AB7D57_04790 [Desulfovibrionaceae bacterium]